MNSKNRCDFIHIIIGGLIAATSTLCSVYLTNEHNKKISEFQHVLDFEKSTLSKRLEILEKSTRIFGKSPGIQDLWMTYRENINKTNNTALSKELAEYQGEFQTVIWLASIYFGQHTKDSIAKMSSHEGPWWNKPKALQDSFIAAMREELYLDIEHIAKNKK